MPFKSAPHFQAQVNGTNKQVGEQIARLNHCVEILKVSQQRSGNPNFFSDYVSKANRVLAEAKKGSYDTFSYIYFYMFLLYFTS